MEPNDSSGLGSYYHHPQLRPPPPPPQATTSSPTNGIGQNSVNLSGMYSHVVPSAAVSTPLDSVVKRKRGRPRKYGTPEQAAAAKRLSALNSSPVTSAKKKDHAFPAGAKKSQLASLGNAGQDFTTYAFTVNDGEDIGQRILLFMQQSKREICVLSASGSVSIASLRQPASSGGTINYEGRFDIVSLSGSYVRTEFGGRTGGLAICLASSDGQLVGGGVGGPLIAAGPIQVIVGAFLIDPRDIIGCPKGETSTSRMQSAASAASVVPGIGFRSPGAFRQNIAGTQYMMQARVVQQHVAPPGSMDWRDNAGHGMQQSPENGDYDDHIQD